MTGQPHNESTSDVCTIVVGVDGSKPSIAALRWALDEATRRGSTVHAVIAWQPEPRIGPDPIVGIPYQPEAEIRKMYAGELAAAVTEAVTGHADQPIHEEVIRGWAPEVLVERARGARLLVLGSHGRTWLVEKLLGSVSAYCVRHAPCPVVVIPAHLAGKPAEQSTKESEADFRSAPGTPGPLL